MDDIIMNNHVDVYKIMRHMAESMYNLNFSMSMYINDMEILEDENKAKIKDFCRYFDKQFAKYNATGSVDAVSFDKKG